MDKNDTLFDFKPIINAHLASAFPDLWNKMNISAAKIPFTYETITEIFCHFGEHIQCRDDMKLNATLDESKDNH